MLCAAGLSLNDVVKVKVLLDNMTNYPAMNGVYTKEFGEHRPARAAYAVSELPLKAKVEMVATAWKSND